MSLTPVFYGQWKSERRDLSGAMLVGRFILITIFSVVVSTACSTGLSSFDDQVNDLIRKKCNFEGPCEIPIREATDFDWDEMYVFRPGITDGEAEKIVPVAKGFKGEFNRKIAFLKDGKLVKRDEASSIIEGEHTPPGMLFFDQGLGGNPDALRYTRYTVFDVSRDKWIRGNVYQLACANCRASPVFAEFGSLSK